MPRLYFAAELAVRGTWFNVSKQDTHFINIFSLVIGLLVMIAICIFAFARIVASHTQNQQVMQEADYNKNVAARLQPPSQEAVSGQDNSALAIKSETPAASGSASPARGAQERQRGLPAGVQRVPRCRHRRRTQGR